MSTRSAFVCITLALLVSAPASSDASKDEAPNSTCAAPAFGVRSIVTDVYDDFDDYQPAITWDGNGYGVAWRNSASGIYNWFAFGRLDANGTVIPPLRELGSEGVEGGTRIVWSGSQYGAVWNETPPWGHSEVYFVRFGQDGTQYGPVIPLTDTTVYKGHSSLVWTGNEFVVVWEMSHEVYLTRVTGGGTIGGILPVTPVDGIDSNRPSLAWNGSEFGLAWQEAAPGSCLAFARLDAVGARIGDPVCVTRLAAPQSLTWTGDGYALVWEGDTDANGDREIWFTRTDYLGTRIGDDVRLSDEAQDQQQPVLVWTGSEFGAVWESEVVGDVWHTLRFTRISADGEKIGATLEDTHRSSGPSLAWNGTRYAIAYGDGSRGNSEVAFLPIDCDCFDDDDDGTTLCEGDCDDGSATTYPGAPELCDGLPNDCDSPEWPTLSIDEKDADQDDVMICEGDCDDGDAATYPGALELCDGKASDCDSPYWPGLPIAERDADQDDVMICEGDCDDGAPGIFPGQLEVCNGVDDDCDGLRDEDESGEDADRDGVFGLCDNCSGMPNAAQTDSDDDGEGDACDLDDEQIYVTFGSPESVDWHQEVGFDSWNLYQGDLDVLRSTGIYTQDPSQVPLAAKVCGLVDPWSDLPDPPADRVVFVLVTGIFTGTTTECDLGPDGSGEERPNTAPCG